MTRRPNGASKPIRPMPGDEPPEEWDEEVLEDLPEEEQEEPVPPT
jgi:hypothetical protein